MRHLHSHRDITLLSLLLVAGCANAPAPQEGRAGGYGTPGVSGYMPAGAPATLQAELDRCRQADAATPPLPEPAFAASCAQLRRTVRNQPGNSVDPVIRPARRRFPVFEADADPLGA